LFEDSKGDVATNTVIYGKNYHPAAFFTPIMLFLSVTFVLLLVIRILVSLLTLAVGMAVWLLLVVRILQEFLMRPLQLLRTIHDSPVPSLAGMGALFGILGHALVCQQQQQQQSSSSSSEQQQPLHQLVFYWLGVLLLENDDDNGATTAAATASSSSSTSMSQQKDMIRLLWACLEGLVYGLELGALWLVVLGDASDPSAITKWIHRKFWRRLQRYYQKSMRQRRRSARIKSSIRVYDDGNDDEDTTNQNSGDNNRRQCMICLEHFASLKEESSSTIMTHKRQRQQLPCLHGFHAECLQQWLAVKPSCPICRVPIENHHYATTMTAVTTTTTAMTQ
jgi:hypothetical protein